MRLFDFQSEAEEHVYRLRKLFKKLPQKGLKKEDGPRGVCLLNALATLERCVNGTKQSDMPGTTCLPEDGGATGSIDCRSDEGVTVGLIDGVIAIARVLRHRQMEGVAIYEALADLRSDEDVAWLFNMSNKKVKVQEGGTAK